MNRAKQIANIIEKRQPLASKIEQVTENLNNLTSALNYLENYRQQLLEKVDEPSLNGRLQEIDVSKAQQDILSELQALAKLKTRYIDKYRQLLQTQSPCKIQKAEIREYVAQDNLQGERIYFNYLAVKEVKIICNFSKDDIGRIAFRLQYLVWEIQVLETKSE